MNTMQKTSNQPVGDMVTYHQDGLIDLYIGLIAILAGVGFLTGLPYLGGIAPALLLPVWQSLHQKVTRSRLASPDRSRSLAIFAVGGLMAGLLFLAVVVFLLQGKNPSWSSWMQEHDLIVMGVILTGLIGALGRVLGIRRFYAYSGLLLLFGAGYKLGADLGWILFSFGILTASSGTAVLIRFIQEYPARYETRL